MAGPSDILSSTAPGGEDEDNRQFADQAEYLKSIDATLRQILQGGRGISQANAENAVPGQRGGGLASMGVGYTFRNKAKGTGIADGFLEGFEDSMMESLFGSGFRDNLKGVFDNLASEMGVSVKDLPSQLGKGLASQVTNVLKGTGLGSKLMGQLNNLPANIAQGAIDGYRGKKKSASRTKSGTSQATAEAKQGSEGGGVEDIVTDKLASELKSKAMSKAPEVLAKMTSKGGTAAKLAGAATKAIPGLAGSAATAGAGATVAGAGATVAGAGATAGAGAIAGAGGVMGAAGGALAAIPGVGWAALAVVAAFKVLKHVMGPATEGFKVLAKAVKEAANRERASRKANLEDEKKRLEEDIRALITAPFTILKEAAEKVEAAWDSNIRTINQTQGYNKADLQGLMGSFADRIRQDGLTKAISGVDIIDSLTNVLGTGLSGKVAEEFAYMATMLNAAVPTQDFFGYAETYSSLAANAIRLGKSESEAIAYANKQMELFASNILYASREVAGGFTTGLKDASSLFSDAVKISQASKTGDPSQIAGVLTSVAAITGSIAPDLASSMTDAIVKAAVGGNSSDIVALRSLAGVNASNTEFLRQLAINPKKIFSTMFSTLASYQNMSPGAYMEVAEGLSSVFGVSMDAFSRIDFNYLAKAISSMNTSSASLDKNIALLASGESTTNAETLRMQRINEYMIEEGLAYVLDNEVARSIQEHMWQEQLAREIREAEYSVHLKGAALEFLEGIRATIDRIVSLLNPFKWLQGVITSAATTAMETAALEQDIKTLLELGKVGAGNAQALMQLTTRGVDLNVTPGIVSLMGGYSAYERTVALREGIQQYNKHPWLAGWDNLINKEGKNSLWAGITTSKAWNSLTGSGPASAYNWGTMGKSQAEAISSHYVASMQAPGIQSMSLMNQAATQSSVDGNFQRMLDSIPDAISNEMNYADWIKTAKEYGISDFDRATKDAGYTKSQIQDMFLSAATEAGKEETDRRNKLEEQYWNTVAFDEGNLLQLTEIGNSWLEQIYDRFGSFMKMWENYFINYTSYYSGALKSNYSNVLAVQTAEKGKSEDAVYALAEALTKNNVDLLDPTVQTNALLSQLLLVANAILQTTNKAGGTGISLPDTIAGLSLGVVKTS